VRTPFTAWLLLFGLLLQSVAWALPAQRAGQALRLAHEVAHARDHGHHQHGESQGTLHGDVHGHGDEADDRADPALALDPAWPGGAPAEHGPHHTHASEAGQVQGLPVAHAPPGLKPAGGAPAPGVMAQPSSADPDGLLRPPQAPA
jgi:hypothetical protein